MSSKSHANRHADRHADGHAERISELGRESGPGRVHPIVPGSDSQSSRFGSKPDTPIAVTVVLFCSQNVDYTASILEELVQYIREEGPDYELVVVLDGHLVGLYARFQERLSTESQVRLLRLNTQQGQVATIRAGLAVARGEVIVTYPAYPQVTTEAIEAVIEGLESGNDYVVGYRSKRGSALNQFASRFFNQMVRVTTGVGFRDIACGVHGLRRAVAGAIPNYGENQLFLPILLSREGFKVGEVRVPSSNSHPNVRLFTPATYARRALDIMTLSYLVRFTQKPLRPFGALGVVLIGVGGILGIGLVYQRLILGQPLAERPMLLLALLLITAGIQVVILGFLGELLIYLHFRGQVNYRVEEQFGSHAEESAKDVPANDRSQSMTDQGTDP